MKLLEQNMVDAIVSKSVWQELPNQSPISDLETAIASSDIGRRAAILRRVADLFASTSKELSAEQTALFDDVMRQLLAEIEASARASFAESLGRRPVAPPRVLSQLALDDEIEVARPILAQAALDDLTLTEGARNKSQAHLLAISKRKAIPECVTDILVERGSREVVLTVAGNAGASFSEFGYSSLVRQSSSDEELAVCTWSRSELPRRHLLELFAVSSDAVRRRLSTLDPRKAAMIHEVVTRAANQLQRQTRESSADFDQALPLVQSLKDAGKLDEMALLSFASADKFAETVLAFSLICDLPVDLVERALVQERSEQLLIFAKAVDLSWKTTKAMLLVQPTACGSAADLDRLLETFLRLKPKTAKLAVDFYRLRERSFNPRSIE